MASNTASNTLRIALLGDGGGPLGRALAEVGTVQDYHPSLPPESIDVLVVDNARAEAGLFDANATAALMEAGCAVGYVGITARQREDIGRACGLSPAVEAAFFIASRRGEGTGRLRVGIVGPPGRAPDGLLTCDESGATTITEVPDPVPDQHALAKTIAAMVGKHFDEPAAAATGLVPPSGATYAGPIFVTCAPASPFQTSASTWNAGKGQQQTISASWTVQIWIYYANGGGGNNYYVIAILPPAASIGTQICYQNNARYFMQATVAPALQLTAANNTVATAMETPGSTTTGSVTEYINVQMSVEAGGTAQPFSATYNNGYTITDWYVTDQSNPSKAQGQWLFFENTTWNPITNPPANFGDWWRQMYSSDNVVTFPAASLGTYNCEAAAAWQVSGNAGNQGPLPVVLNMSVGQGIYGFANADGDSGHHQISGLVITWTSALNLDLIALT